MLYLIIWNFKKYINKEFTCWLASKTSWGGISSVPISRANNLESSWTWYITKHINEDNKKQLKLYGTINFKSTSNWSLTLLTAVSTKSLGHNRLAGSETTPNGCPRESRVFNQSCEHWRAKLRDKRRVSMVRKLDAWIHEESVSNFNFVRSLTINLFHIEKTTLKLLFLTNKKIAITLKLRK